MTLVLHCIPNYRMPLVVDKNILFILKKKWNLNNGGTKEYILFWWNTAQKQKQKGQIKSQR